MTGLEDFLRRAKASGSDKKAHWEVSLNDGTTEQGEIVDVLADAVILRQIVKRSSANTRYQAVQVLEDAVHVLLPFASIRLVRVLDRAGDST